MGWEYHRRTRDTSGRFYSPSPGRRRAQSIKRGMTLSRYVLTAAVRFEQVSRFMHNRQRRKDRGPLEEESPCDD